MKGMSAEPSLNLGPKCPVCGQDIVPGWRSGVEFLPKLGLMGVSKCPGVRMSLANQVSASMVRRWLD